MADRQDIIENNRSIRTIKNELEALLEKGVIPYNTYESIHALLPAESPLNGYLQQHKQPTTSSPSATPAAARVASPIASPASTGPPPSYAQTTGSQPPALPNRNKNGESGPPAPPPSKPVIARARALYHYAATDGRDVSLDRNDQVAVYEYMNADWWMGRNERTLQEGIFPRTYVEVVPDHGNKGGIGEKAGGVSYYRGQQQQHAYTGPQQPQYGGYPPPPGPQQQNPYNSSVPPMAVAEQPQQQQGQGGGKAGEMGKKFGKKLGNAAIFGAGASIGSNIVNSIF